MSLTGLSANDALRCIAVVHGHRSKDSDGSTAGVEANRPSGGSMAWDSNAERLSRLRTLFRQDTGTRRRHARRPFVYFEVRVLMCFTRR